MFDGNGLFVDVLIAWLRPFANMNIFKVDNTLLCAKPKEALLTRAKLNKQGLLSMTSYTLSTHLALPIDDAITQLTALMQEVGLGIVSDVDVQKTIKTKLNEDIAPYRILGACNPVLAKRLIDAVPQAGALLPCTVVARELDGKTYFDFMSPKAVIGLEKHPVANEIAQEADTKIKQLIKAIEQT
jgi:uncharacterized protein (DUF302 family)